MTVAGTSPWLEDESTVPRLVQVVIEPDGATMSCFYCQHTAPILAAEVASQIQRFQEAHFGCDPTVAAWTTTPAEGTVPRQAGTDLTRSRYVREAVICAGTSDCWSLALPSQEEP